MEIVRSVAGMRRFAGEARAAGRRVGLVPTMGALHAGHLSLVRRARAECDAVVLSIYVNPLQFGPGEDFQGYPRDLERDRAAAAAAEVNRLFVPDDAAIHVPGECTRVEVEGLGEALCGRSRPGHFRGVATVVAKLLLIVRPDAAYFGEKDAQQLRVVRRMVSDLHFETAIVGCPIVREPDGLALSSRNAYLTPAERRAAPVLHRALCAALDEKRRGETSAARLAGRARAVIAAEPLARLEYVEAVDGETLVPVERAAPGVLLAAAAWFGRARLIDNVVLD